MTAVVWGPGDHLGPHDHQTWGMIGVWNNVLTETRFRRVDDRTQERYTQLEQDRRATFKPGEVTLLVPEVDEIHQRIGKIKPLFRQSHPPAAPLPPCRRPAPPGTAKPWAWGRAAAMS